MASTAGLSHCEGPRNGSAWAAPTGIKAAVEGRAAADKQPSEWSQILHPHSCPIQCVAAPCCHDYIVVSDREGVELHLVIGHQRRDSEIEAPFPQPLTQHVTWPGRHFERGPCAPPQDDDGMLRPQRMK